jgi:hypothetical protein
LENATIDSVVEDARYHDEFKLVRPNKKPPCARVPRGSDATIDSKGNAWLTPFEWLSSYFTKGIKI